MNSDAALLFQELETLYSEYAQGIDRRGERRGFARLFLHWFTYNADDTAQADDDFLNKSAELAEKLAGAVSGLSEQEKKEDRDLALQGARLVLLHRGFVCSQSRSLYMAAAEPSCRPLLPLLTAEELEGLRKEMLADTPRRMMFPRQEELLKEIEAMISRTPV